MKKIFLATLFFTIIFPQDVELIDIMKEKNKIHAENNWSEYKKSKDERIPPGTGFPEDLFDQRDKYKIFTIDDGRTELTTQIYDSYAFDDDFGTIWVPFWEGGSRYLGSGPRMNDKSYVVIKDRIEREELILFLKNSYDKFESWKKNAIENNITSYEKEIDRLDILSVNWHQNGGSGFFKKTYMTTNMVINYDGRVSFYIFMPGVQERSGYIYTKDVSERLTIKDINSLENILSQESVISHMEEAMVKDKKLLWVLYYKIKEIEDLEKKKEDLFQ